MKSYINYKIIKGLKLIVEYYSGPIYFDDFITIHDRKSNDKDFNLNYNLLIDFRDAEIHLEKEDILRLVDYHRDNNKLYGSRYAAHITKTPKQVVAGTMFDVLNKQLPITIKVFSTVKASLIWLGVFKDKSKIESYLEALKNESYLNSDHSNDV